MEELGIVDTLTYLRRSNRHRGKEALVAVGEASALAELARELASVIPVSIGQWGKPFERAGWPKRFDQRFPSRHSLGPALAIVAEEHLVATLPAQHDFHVLGSGPRQIPERHGRGRGAGLVERSLYGWQNFGGGLRLQRQDDMLAADVIRDSLRGGRFVPSRAGKANREGFE